MVGSEAAEILHGRKDLLSSVEEVHCRVDSVERIFGFRVVIRYWELKLRSQVACNGNTLNKWLLGLNRRSHAERLGVSHEGVILVGLLLHGLIRR